MQYLKSIIRPILFLLLFLFGQVLHAQKYQYYTTTISRFSFDILFSEQSDGTIQGYYLDNLSREKVAIHGHHNPLGDYWILACSDERAPFYQLVLQGQADNNNLIGHYYSLDQTKGNCSLKATAYPEYFEIRPDLKAFSNIHQKIYEDFGLDNPRVVPLFQMEPNTGKLYFVDDEGLLTNASLLLEPRKMVEMNSIRVIFEDIGWQTNTQKYSQKLYFQIISYHPSMTVLVVSEEQVLNIVKQDTSAQQIFRFATYKEKTEGWVNITKDAFPDYQEERLHKKIPSIHYKMEELYFQLSFRDEPNVTLYCNVPRTALFVPKEGAVQMVLDWSWTPKGFVFR